MFDGEEMNNELENPVEILKNDDATVLVTREQIQNLENEVSKLEQVEIPVINYFSKGIYAREITIPKGTVLTGKIHKYAHLNIISKGDITVLTEDGMKRISAPHTMVSSPGTKRAGYAHEDTVWTTIHGTEETDVEKIEEIFIAKSHEEYLSFCAALQIKEE